MRCPVLQLPLVKCSWVGFTPRFIPLCPAIVTVVPPVPVPSVVLVVIVLWAIFQLGFPLRHFLVPGNVSWTEEGHLFAWHMMLRSKSEDVTVMVERDDGSVTSYSLTDEDLPVPLTRRHRDTISGRAYIMVQYAHAVAEQPGVEGVYFDVWASLNSREWRLLIDPEVDLSKEPLFWLGHAPWVFHEDEALRRVYAEPGGS